ncbi:alpha/beta fold hydrolase [Flavihumibacter fluvii]|uniref:alpha/beta fold hydrolase n=1 Tax=Flavihumibacter fluvii TaxID=2838157 RepID=UPI001BDDDC8C|nr:alpha/beta hydrolase [Flavihumibacter fluvii]ULQ54702.1 alpha/beta hydrolase [Flavihumibacter fluvii]
MKKTELYDLQPAPQDKRLDEILVKENPENNLYTAALIAGDTGREDYITVGPKVKLHVKDYGEGKPVILIHGWPLSSDMWEYQIDALVNSGFRVIAYDRRGFGKSTQTWNGYDYNTLTDDLQTIIAHLQLEDVTLVGFSMGGGEVARYFSRYDGAHVTKAVFISSVTPFRLQTTDNPAGTPRSVFDENAEKIKADRISFLDAFGKKFFGVQDNVVSAVLLEYYRMLGSLASPRATLQCAESFAFTDFRKDLAKIHVPTLVIHGDKDENVPIDSSARIAVQLIPNNTYFIYAGAPHGLFYTEREKLNTDLINFLKK